MCWVELYIIYNTWDYEKTIFNGKSYGGKNPLNKDAGTMHSDIYHKIVVMRHLAAIKHRWAHIYHRDCSFVICFQAFLLQNQ